MSALLKDSDLSTDGEEVEISPREREAGGRIFPRVRSQITDLLRRAGTLGGRNGGYDPDPGGEDEDQAPPKDRFHLVYVCLLMGGMGFLIPWSCFIGAIDYFFYYYQQEFPSVSVVIPVDYLLTTFLAATLNLVLVRVVAVLNRISFGYIMFVISLTLIPLLDIGIHNCTIPTSISFYLTLICVALVGLGSGVQQSSYYGLSSMLPRRYTQAVMAGESVAGVLVICLRVVTKGAASSVRTGAFLFFGISLGFVLLCVLCHCYLRRSRVVRYYMRQCRAKAGPESTGQRLGGEEDKVLSSSEENSDQQKLLSTSESIEMKDRLNQYEPEADGISGKASSSPDDHHSASALDESHLRRNLKMYLSVVKQIWPLISAIFVAFFVTLLLFPGLLSEVQNCTLGSWTPILIIAVFNFIDFFAKWLALIPIRWPPKVLLAISALRLVLVPLIIMCVAPSPSSPVFGENVVVWAALFTFVLALTNGYFGSLPMINVSAHVKNNKDRELAGTIMTWSLLLGLLLGSVVAYALSPLTTIHKHVLCSNNATTSYFDLCGHGNHTSNMTSLTL